MKELQDHELKSWLTGAEYLAAIQAAEDDCRTLSGYLRFLVRQDLALKALATAEHSARADQGHAGADAGHP